MLADLLTAPIRYERPRAMACRASLGAHMRARSSPHVESIHDSECNVLDVDPTCIKPGAGRSAGGLHPVGANDIIKLGELANTHVKDDEPGGCVSAPTTTPTLRGGQAFKLGVLPLPTLGSLPVGWHARARTLARGCIGLRALQNNVRRPSCSTFAIEN